MEETKEITQEEKNYSTKAVVTLELFNAFIEACSKHVPYYEFEALLSSIRKDAQIYRQEIKEDGEANQETEGSPAEREAGEVRANIEGPGRSDLTI